ncbi:hypothetical protein DICPUDRAFT_75594 [Dictyostelium purpureum]|uniref:Uncharacterized protein n=1 Tax=Dictyostelium purpureum TaxID=5786 RepID=F0ZB41_DICPU|nr:uncharacterized protein DICPUDRAFT_75594 [Dictyostelium purpureum]EGC38853.1 hypothetical protein DICPUDRAFT_75594 [Dictyostelium purpureum]|eukprot:XP_003284647.1 hypothetical protein DICPUDRAFT_75594 [Dictyostelium purpureum]
MGNFFSKKEIFENQVLAMESRIANMESKINSSKTHLDNNYKKIIFYFIIIEFILVFSLYNIFFSSDTLSEKAMCFVYSLLISIVIYTFAKIYRFTYGLDQLFEERKRVTDYEHTKKLLENYEIFKKKNLSDHIDNKNKIEIIDNEFFILINHSINIRHCSGQATMVLLNGFR